MAQKRGINQTVGTSFLVGVPGFEPGTLCSQSRCANRAALHPEHFCDCKGTQKNVICKFFRTNFRFIFRRSLCRARPRGNFRCKKLAFLFGNQKDCVYIC